MKEVNSFLQVLVEYLKSERPHNLPEKIYLRLCTSDPSLHEEAINMIKTHKVRVVPYFNSREQ